MFVGRKRELDSLNRSYLKNKFQFAVIYGRRRVGKTTLINEFCRGRKTVFFVAVQSSAKENLDILSAQILQALAPQAPKNPFPSFREAIDFIFKRAKSEQIIFAIDEFPYLAGSDKSVSSVLQAAIDKYHTDSKLYLILCGSSMSFMENQVLGYESPVYGRRTSQYKILPFDYYESAELLNGFNNEEKITLYSVTGGIPEYLSRIDNDLSLRENICELFFNPSGRLFEEPSNLLKQELKMPETYNAIITAIASGSSKLNEIAARAGIESSQCSKMLKSLISLGIVAKEYPITETTSKKSVYSLNDWMFVFWYRFVFPELSRITAGLGEVVCDEVISRQINSHVGRAFEACAKQYMWRMLREQKLALSFQKIGRWWGNNPKHRREEEIDFIAFAGKDAIFGECKWQNDITKESALKELMEKANHFSNFSNIRYVLFSKSGFSDSLVKICENEQSLSLVKVDDMF